MNSQSKKLELQIEVAETAFRDRLLGLLPGAATSGANLFTNSDFNPSSLLPQHFHPDADDLLQQARECIRLREQIGIVAPDTVGNLFLKACEENASKNPHRRGPRRLAETLLAQLRDTST
jgi:hypothetical protein